MSRRFLALVFLLALVLNFGFKSLGHGESLEAKSALILYDAPPDEPKLGITYALMLKALLGHFDLRADIRPVGDYRTGELSSYSTLFYLGSYYNNPLPDDFLRDVAKSNQRVVWFKYNLWQLSSPSELQFESKNGLSFVDLHGLDSEPSSENPNPGFYDTVQYKGKSLVKYYHYDKASGEVSADPDIGLVRINDPKKAQTRVMIQDSHTHESAPYIVQAGPQGRFWYIADLPFSYIGPRDRYLVFCDILHDILEVHHAENHRALVRLEDVSAKVVFSSMQTLSDYLASQNIPFSIAVIPHYKDPLGLGTGGNPESISFDQALELQRSLKYAMDKGGSIVMHGFTHQYNSMKNPNSAISADDFEFWNIVANSPVAEDSEAWASERLSTGLSELATQNISPWAWETPHYQASPLSYLAMTKRFPVSYQRMVYYSSTHPNLHAEGPQRDYAAGIFFPFIIEHDTYGNRVIPENLGNIEYDISSIDPSSNITYTWKDIVENADDALIVRDGFASFFFHPFWLDPGFEDLDAFSDFKKTVEGITRLGYQWTDAKTLGLESHPAFNHE
jgi:uncharacterized protein YdaL